MTNPLHQGYTGLTLNVSVKKLPDHRFEPGRPTVGHVDPGSPAAKAGLVVGDEIIAINGMTNPGGSFAPGLTQVLRVRRGDEEREIVLVADASRPRDAE